jgi:hypothetical protein
VTATIMGDDVVVRRVFTVDVDKLQAAMRGPSTK